MASRKFHIERILRDVYGGYIPADSEITVNLVNAYINQGIALAVKQNYNDAIQLDGIAYINNSFYLTFKGLAITADENFIYKVQLPHIPVGIGKNEGVSTLQFKDATGLLSYTALPLSQNQVGYRKGLRPIPNKIFYWPEGDYLYAETTYILTSGGLTASVRMVSGGDSTNLDSNLNVPDDFIPIIDTFVTKLLLKERMVPKDAASDGIDKP